MLLCLFCPGLHVSPARLSLHEGSLDLALLHPTATQLGPINIFWSLVWLQLYLLNPLHLSFHCAPFTVFCSLRSHRSPCQSTDSCTLRIADTCRCDSTVSPPARTWDWDLFCFLHHLCVARLPAHQRSCPCTVAVKLRQSVAPSGCSWRCNAPVCWRLLKKHSRLSLWSNVLQFLPVSCVFQIPVKILIRKIDKIQKKQNIEKQKENKEKLKNEKHKEKRPPRGHLPRRLKKKRFKERSVTRNRAAIEVKKFRFNTKGRTPTFRRLACFQFWGLLLSQTGLPPRRTPSPSTQKQQQLHLQCSVQCSARCELRTECGVTALDLSVGVQMPLSARRRRQGSPPLLTLLHMFLLLLHTHHNTATTTPLHSLLFYLYFSFFTLLTFLFFWHFWIFYLFLTHFFFSFFVFFPFFSVFSFFIFSPFSIFTLLHFSFTFLPFFPFLNLFLFFQKKKNRFFIFPFFDFSMFLTFVYFFTSFTFFFFFFVFLFWILFTFQNLLYFSFFTFMFTFFIFTLFTCFYLFYFFLTFFHFLPFLKKPFSRRFFDFFDFFGFFIFFVFTFCLFFWPFGSFLHLFSTFFSYFLKKPFFTFLLAFFFTFFLTFFFLFFLFFTFSPFIFPPFLFVEACPMFITHAAVSAVAAAEQQPEGWRFVPDTILPGYQWAPQWVPARTQTVHWGPISGKAVGGPNTVQHSSTVQKHSKRFFPFSLFFLFLFFPFFFHPFFPPFFFPSFFPFLPFFFVSLSPPFFPFLFPSFFFPSFFFTFCFPFLHPSPFFLFFHVFFSFSFLFFFPFLFLHFFYFFLFFPLFSTFSHTLPSFPYFSLGLPFHLFTFTFTIDVPAPLSVLKETVAVMKLLPYQHAQTDLECPAAVHQQGCWRSRDEAVKKSRIRFRDKVVDSSCPKENRQRRTDAASAVPESEAKAKSQYKEFRRRARYSQSGCQSLEHWVSPVRDSGEMTRLDQAAMEMQTETEHRKPAGYLAEWRRPAERSQFGTRKATGLRQCWTTRSRRNRLNRSRSAQEIKKHVSDGIRAENKPKTSKTKEAKDFSKSEAELVDVMDTFHRTVSIIEKETAKNLVFLKKEIDTRNPNSIRTALIRRKTSRSRVFSKQCQWCGVPLSRSSTSSC